MTVVEIHHLGDAGERLVATGVIEHGVVAYWWGFEDRGTKIEQLSFLLVEEGVLLSQPVTFPPQQRGWWYCDLVQVTRVGDALEFRDQFVDVIVGPPELPYRVLDLDEYADAAADGRLSAAAAADGLRRFQVFLDRHLNRRHDVTPTWPDFPPAPCLAVDPTQVPRRWRWVTPSGSTGR